MSRGTFHSSLVLAALSSSFALSAAPASAVPLSGSLSIHDPSRIHLENGRYYTYATGFSRQNNSGAPISTKYSDNFTDWTTGPAVFDEAPQWAQAEVPNNPSFAWAPDLFYFDGEYRMYYSVSSFGSQNSVIGLATNTTLDFNDPLYQWVDQQLVIESEVGRPYNAIDAGIFYDDDTTRMWMAFGSHWQGVYVVELDPSSGKLLNPGNPTLTNVARNPANQFNAVEAAYLTKNDGDYFLFVNWDSCCQGSNSTYNIRVGRSDSPDGPFVDRSGRRMTSGGGELLLGSEGSQIGPGHFSEFSEGGIDYFSYHYYDGDDRGRSKLGIERLVWGADGWPVLARHVPEPSSVWLALIGAAVLFSRRPAKGIGRFWQAVTVR